MADWIQRHPKWPSGYNVTKMAASFGNRVVKKLLLALSILP